MKLYVGNLPTQVNDAKLNELATPFGTVVSANVATEKGNGASRGFGFIEFSNATEANAAIAGLNGREMEGKTLKVNEAKPKNANGAART
ncbi:MAG TPA: RNA-binding protein [Thermoanaerobaculia bacterium]|nr:RNA-binding protein [Thermoanaerobaculia bacterium]